MELLKPCLRRLCHSAKERFAVRVDTLTTVFQPFTRYTAAAWAQD